MTARIYDVSSMKRFIDLADNQLLDYLIDKLKTLIIKLKLI